MNQALVGVVVRVSTNGAGQDSEVSQVSARFEHCAGLEPEPYMRTKDQGTRNMAARWDQDSSAPVSGGIVDKFLKLGSPGCGLQERGRGRQGEERPACGVINHGNEYMPKSVHSRGPRSSGVRRCTAWRLAISTLLSPDSSPMAYKRKGGFETQQREWFGLQQRTRNCFVQSNPPGMGSPPDACSLITC